jgi:hypothetical protein
LAAVATPTLTPTPRPTQTPTSTPKPTPTPSPTPIAYGPASAFTGTESCNISEGTTTTDPDGTMHGRGGSVECRDTANDPRMSGTGTGAWEYDAWTLSGGIPGALVQWGEVRLVNDGGAWEGRLTGTYSADHGDTITIWYTGTGGYTGLAAFELITGRGPWTIDGLIFPGTPPTP